MSWQVNIVFEPHRFGWNVFIWQEVESPGSQIMRFRDGGVFMEPLPVDRAAHVEPTFTLDGRSGQQILAGFAQQLTQLGFGSFDQVPVVKAHERTITNLEKQNAELHEIITRLINKVNLT